MVECSNTVRRSITVVKIVELINIVTEAAVCIRLIRESTRARETKRRTIEKQGPDCGNNPAVVSGKNDDQPRDTDENGAVSQLPF